MFVDTTIAEILIGAVAGQKSVRRPLQEWIKKIRTQSVRRKLFKTDRNASHSKGREKKYSSTVAQYTLKTEGKKGKGLEGGRAAKAVVVVEAAAYILTKQTIHSYN